MYFKTPNFYRNRMNITHYTICKNKKRGKKNWIYVSIINKMLVTWWSRNLDSDHRLPLHRTLEMADNLVQWYNSDSLGSYHPILQLHSLRASFPSRSIWMHSKASSLTSRSTWLSQHLHQSLPTDLYPTLLMPPISHL